MRIPVSRKTIHTGYAGREVVKTPGWHDLVVWDVFFNAMTTGLFIVAALAELCLPSQFRTVSLYAYPVALVFLTVDLLLLVLDLGDPWRFHHMLRVFKPSSPMSLGTWCLTIYSLPLTLMVMIDLATLLDLLPRDSSALEWVRRLLLVLGLPFALGSAIYKGVLFSTSSQPGWRVARWFGGYLTNSALVLGCANLIVIAVICGQAEAVATLHLTLPPLLVINLIPLMLLGREVYPEISKHYSRSQNAGIVVVMLGVGVLIPVVLLILISNSVAIFVAVGCILAANWLSRYLLVMLPHHGPK
jgi:formate-dependent nitrite reductase membrane component NrfD